MNESRFNSLLFKYQFIRMFKETKVIENESINVDDVISIFTAPLAP